MIRTVFPDASSICSLLLSPKILRFVSGTIFRTDILCEEHGSNGETWLCKVRLLTVLLPWLARQGEKSPRGGDIFRVVTG